MIGDCTKKLMLLIYGRSVAVIVPPLREPLMLVNSPAVTPLGVVGRPAGAATSVNRLIVCVVPVLSIHVKLPACAACVGKFVPPVGL